MANGILIVDKPSGWTSQDVAAKLRGVFHERRVGHGGTLDPMATGVLPIFIGRATRGAEFLEHAEKEYVAGLRLGLVTNTQDTSGETLETHPVSVTRQALEAALTRFTGPIEQIPPMYSAIKIGGKKLCDLARQGVEVERKARRVNIYSIETSDVTNDGFTMKDGKVSKETNHAGGILGGMSDGSDIVLKAHFKPTPSIASAQNTVSKSGEDIEVSIRGRHDPIIGPRAVVVVESMTALTILDLLFENMSSRMDKIVDFYND